MSGTWRGIAALLAALSLAACQSTPAVDEEAARWARQLAEQQGAGTPLARIDQPPGTLTLERAYQVQRLAVLAQLDDALPAGFKAGLTTAASRQAFGVDEPVAAVLWPDSALAADAGGRYRLSLSGLALPMIELELGFELARAITAPLAGVEQLRERVAGVRTVLELPDIAFAGAPTGADLVAGNVGSHRYVAGPLRPLSDVAALDALQVQLWHEGETLIDAAGSVMADQWEALLWLVNRVLANGWTLHPGQVLLTGAIGPMLPLREGHYRGVFGPLGELQLVVEP